MPSYPSPIPAPIFDSDESDSGSQQSNDSSSYLSSEFHQHTRLSYSPQLTIQTNHQDDLIYNIQSTPSNKKRKRSNDKTDQIYLQTPKQSPYTRRKNLDYVQENTLQSPKIQRRSRHYEEIPSTNLIMNINPFSPEPTQHRYHTRLVSKRESTSLRQLIIERFEQEFHHESFLGYGQFSHVYLCRNRLDGLNYAIKTSKQTILGTCYEQIAWRELCAYAILTSHENLVRYYSGWIESDGRFCLQLEYCNGGCLENYIEKNLFNEQQLITFIHQLSDVLTFMHGKDLAHMDIKPSNIMLCQYDNNDIIYKLTDLGHVSQISSCQIDEDGDCRYLALEIIQKYNSKKLSLDKCDIYSLGLTAYVCATNYNLPKQGNEWQELRLNISEYLYTIPQCSKELNDFIFKRMCNIDPNQRPTASEILFDTIINPIIPTNRELLRYNLKQEREKNLLLNKKLLDQYILTNSSDIQILTNNNYLQDISLQQTFSPIQLTLNDISPNTPNSSINFNQSISSPINCGLLAIKQQVKLAGSNMFRYYSSII